MFRRKVDDCGAMVDLDEMERLTISVVIPSYGRPGGLRACLAGVAAQGHPPDEIIVVLRPEDTLTVDVVDDLTAAMPQLRTAQVLQPGLVAALNAGLLAARCDVLAYIDDDAVPRADWLKGMLRWYTMGESVAAVGGRDVVHIGGRLYRDPRRPRVGRDTRVGTLSWFGRLTGGHHAPNVVPREVDVIKGANMSFRRACLSPLGFDPRLAGTGSQVHNEATACLPLRRRGLRVIFDPAILVDHYVSERAPGDERLSADPVAIRNAGHNHALAVFDHRGPLGKVAFACFSLFVGTGALPGLANAIRLIARRSPGASARFWGAQKGWVAGWRTHQTPRPLLTAELSKNHRKPSAKLPHRRRRQMPGDA